jgi:hypothetical protein
MSSDTNFNSDSKLQDKGSALEDRIRYIPNRGDICNLYATGLNYDSPTNSFSWLNPPPICLRADSLTTHDYHDIIHQSKKIKVNLLFNAFNRN